ncbi:hypothetical protein PAPPERLAPAPP_05050 [Brevundimonas phage vB_BpoS-Papperlapapp]|uniref:Uncharacterized protein n=2 Tax=Marchewkavirus TaxID=3425052 RepID=A0A9E7MPD7_9CAUD|nr:hypothetical protein KABACHOK_03420 [Brevundimonas phage vB_BpoS-Kabachok]USN14873.1 hypothetical protein DOMOVOI_03990 [Brevundimonas phage vB_BpoS-Domovoi]USN16246.1 hypothetical protein PAPPERLAPAPP_05050 [Brevundimonas phage vB_BpoS-Papperlapapp]
MLCPENAMTVVGAPRDKSGPIILRLHASHYAQAVQALLEETAADLRDDLSPEEEADPQAQADADHQAWNDACDHFTSVKVYRGHPLEGSDVVTPLQLIHEE